ncbi:MAG: hypothetical protein DRN17_00170 [Thermoplasmata archaeon]|nr:MAG: hypothetical protein DRN17_00170 [Thermoplasmata archaeon]
MEQKVIITAESFSVEEKTDGGFRITGLALPFGQRSRNGLTYNKESIIETADLWVGLPSLFNHDQDKPIGHIEKTWIEDDGLHYQINVDEEEEALVRKLKRGDIPFVSIMAIVDKAAEDMDGDVMIKSPLEISICTLPGFPQTNIQTQNVTVAPDSNTYQSDTFSPIIPEGAIAIEKFVGENDTRVGEPFGEYKDFEDCVKKNQDKDSPEGFCAWLHKKITGKWPSEQALTKIQVNNIRGNEIKNDNMADEKEDLEALKAKVNLLEEEIKQMKEQDAEPAEPSDEPDINDKIKELEDKIADILSRLDALEKGEAEEPTSPSSAPQTAGDGNESETLTREELVEKLRRL